MLKWVRGVRARGMTSQQMPNDGVAECSYAWPILQSLLSCRQRSLQTRPSMHSVPPRFARAGTYVAFKCIGCEHLSISHSNLDT